MSTFQGSRTPYLYGLLAGLGSFVGGYLITYLWRGRDVERSLQSIETILTLFQAEPIGTWRVVGWVWYSAHFVDTRVSATLGPVETTMHIDLLREGSGNLELLYLVPPVLLIGAGFFLVTYLRIEDITEGAKFGATITIGYFLAVAVGLVVFAYGDTGPDPVPAVVVAGVLYPIVFGAAGGVLASTVKTGRS